MSIGYKFLGIDNFSGITINQSDKVRPSSRVLVFDEDIIRAGFVFLGVLVDETRTFNESAPSLANELASC